MKKIISIALLASLALICLSFTGCTFSTYFYADSGKYTAGAGDVTDVVGRMTGLDVSWMSGSVTLEYADTDKITLSETANEDFAEKMALHWYFDGSTLFVKYCESGIRMTDWRFTKDLVLTIPETLSELDIKIGNGSGKIRLQDVKAKNLDIGTASGGVEGTVSATGNISISSASGTVKLEQIGTAGDVDVDSASGKVDLKLGTVKDVSVDSASGDVNITADRLKVLDIDTASGDVSLDIGASDKITGDTASGRFKAKLHTLPDKYKIDTASGDVELKIPEDAGFTAKFSSASGDFDFDGFSIKKSGKSYVCGDGKCEMNFSTASGDVTLKVLE